MKRRDFLKVLLASSFYLGARRVFPQVLSDTAEVGVAVGRDYELAVRRAVELVGGIRRFVKPGDVVAVKPNASFNQPPELKANTDPRIVRTVVLLCFEALASRVYVLDRSLTSPKLSYRTSGIEKAVEEAGADMLYVNDITRRNYTEITVKGGQYLERTLVSRHVLEADVFINVPVAKHHSLAGLTLGMKNLMGISGDNRSRWHWRLAEALCDINREVPSDLTVIDATHIMVRGGPTGGSTSFLKRLDTVIASTNVVSADSEAAKLFDREPESLSYLKLAAKRGIGKTSGYTLKRAAR